MASTVSPIIRDITTVIIKIISIGAVNSLKNILRILTHISNASHEIMTGGEIDAHNAFLEF